MKTCLVVDDSGVIRKVARRILEQAGWHISEAENGREALTHCQGQMPDVILVDWLMPVMGGHEFVSALRLLPQGRRPFVIYCTTEFDPVDIAKILAAGADDYMLKPYDRVELREKLDGLSRAA